jgi:hypothetical protein
MKNFVVNERKHHLNFAKDQELKIPALRLCVPRDFSSHNWLIDAHSESQGSVSITPCCAYAALHSSKGLAAVVHLLYINEQER